MPDEDARELQVDVIDRYRNYSSLAVESALGNPAKLADLLPRLDDLDEPDVEGLLKHLTSSTVKAFGKQDRRMVWEAAIAAIRRQDRFPDAEWHWNDDLIGRLRLVANHLEPLDPVDRYRHLFVQWGHEFYIAGADYQEEERRLWGRRDDAVREVVIAGGLDAVLTLAKEAECAHHVGTSYARHELALHSSQAVESWVAAEDTSVQGFAAGFIGVGIDKIGDGWLDTLQVGEWPFDARVRLLRWLRFSPPTWERADRWLGDEVAAYWTSCNVNEYQHEGDLTPAVHKLRRNGRPMRALGCLHRMIESDWFDAGVLMDTLIEAAHSQEAIDQMFSHHVQKIIQRLQSSEDVDLARLQTVEWLYLPLLEHRHDYSPKTLERVLAEDSESFCELIRAMFRPSDPTKPHKSVPDENKREFGKRSHRLLTDWTVPPGTLQDDSFDSSACAEWYEGILASLQDSGHEATGMHMAGQVLRHVPSDPDGLWLNRGVAELLNRPGMRELRGGYEIGIINSRGCHFIAPDGSGEDALADQWFEKAEDIENAGYHRLAVTLRAIADRYRREAENIRRTHDSD